MNTTNTDTAALQFALHLSCSEFVGPAPMQRTDEDALAIRFVYEGLSVQEAVSLATAYTYGYADHLGGPPAMPDDFQGWLDHPPARSGLTPAEQEAVAAMKADLSAQRSAHEGPTEGGIESENG